MKKLLALSLFAMVAASGCANNNGGSNNSGPVPADANTLAAIEQEAALDGVSIRHDTPIYSDNYKGQVTPLTVSWGGVGYTDDEMKTAIQVLRKYHAAVTVATSIQYDSDRKQQLDVIDDAMSSMQSKRNDILTKQICGATHDQGHDQDQGHSPDSGR